MSAPTEVLALAHARPGCRCRTFAEETFRVEGTTYRVRVPVCRSGPAHRAALVRLVEQVSQYRLLAPSQGLAFLRSRLLPPALLARVETAWGAWVTLRGLARLTRQQPRLRCAWCQRRFNRRVGPARAALVHRRRGRRLEALTLRVCSLACRWQVIHENVRYLQWLASEWAVVRALKKQLRTLRRLVKEQEGPPPPASMCN